MKAVIFDCFGVFVVDSYSRHLSELDRIDPEKAQRARDINRATNRGYISIQEANDELSKLFNVSSDELTSAEVLDERLIEFAKSLKPVYKIALLSNVSSKSYLVGKFDNYNIDELFDVVVASGDEGIIKPDERIYKITAGRLGVLPEECIMVDDIEDFCLAAEEVGMKSVHFKSTSQLIEDITLLIDSGDGRD